MNNLSSKNLFNTQKFSKPNLLQQNEGSKNELNKSNESILLKLNTILCGTESRINLLSISKNSIKRN